MRHRPHPPSSPRPRDAHDSAPVPLRAHQQASRVDRAFLAPNAIGLAVSVVLGVTADDLLAQRLPGTQVTVGLLLYLAQALVLLETARRFDRRSARLLDPWQWADAPGAGEAR